MLQLLKKIVFYGFLILVGLELLVRIFYLQNGRPVRFGDDKNVEKWIPNQRGYSVTGNRRQNVGKYQINNFGFNSVHSDYNPTQGGKEIALVGDSFIEGFHEDYTHSLGQQIEKQLKATTVLEFGYAGYDLADELHLIQAYNDFFKNIDHTFIYLRYTDDLDRDAYEISSRLGLDSPISRAVKQIKLLAYLKDIGALDPLTQLPGRIIGFISTIKGNTNRQLEKTSEDLKKEKIELDHIKLDNFIKLMTTYPLVKDRFTFLLDKSLCSESFLDYLITNDFKTLDLNEALGTSKEPTTLIYDQHWSKHGRHLIADLILNYIDSGYTN
jgi:hypothetical protein